MHGTSSREKTRTDRNSRAAEPARARALEPEARAGDAAAARGSGSPLDALQESRAAPQVCGAARPRRDYARAVRALEPRNGSQGATGAGAAQDQRQTQAEGILIAEVWLRGPLPGIQPALQPVAAALLQVAEELPPALAGLPPDRWWHRPGRSAPIGYHVAHLTGSLDRLLTYARGSALSAEQLAALSAERTIVERRPPAATLIPALVTGLGRAMEQVRATPADQLAEPRAVGRKQLPATTLGLLYHAAEHTARHAGQIATLLRVLE